GSEQANFRGHDFPVQAVLAFLALATVAKCSSDGFSPSSDATDSVAKTALARAQAMRRAGR
ncbi:hypothetical protein, partial [uncultured Pseudacidovorax sp.]|uniref:hypothetical protein n=1 Tax=uncultured Pseudacidovorax sp. TaxID=679313 RepID=UPI0025D7170F